MAKVKMNHSLGWSDGGGWGRRQRKCVLARLWKAANISQGILGCVSEAVGGPEGL